MRSKESNQDPKQGNPGQENHRGLQARKPGSREESQNRAAVRDAETTPAPGGKILLVDDTPTNLQLLTSMLEELGHSVQAAQDGELALQLAKEDPPDIVLLDIKMPQMDGHQVLEHLRKEVLWRGVRVIMITAVHETASVVRCIEQGADDYLTKPIDVAILKARVDASLERKRSRDRERRLHRQLLESYAELQAAQRARDGLFHMIVHDVKSPLTVVQSLSSLMIKEAKSDTINAKELLEDLESIYASSIRIEQLVEDILYVGKAEDGEIGIDLAPTNLVDLAMNCCRSITFGTEIPSHSISFDSSSTEGLVLADESLMARIIQNLLTNALQHTPPGSRIHCSVDRCGPEYHLAVQDEGQGIAEEHREKVFDKFYQVAARMQGRGGVGLGLAFCKLAIEAQNGRIWVENPEGGGACFKISLLAFER